MKLDKGLWVFIEGKGRRIKGDDGGNKGYYK